MKSCKIFTLTKEQTINEPPSWKSCAHNAAAPGRVRTCSSPGWARRHSASPQHLFHHSHASSCTLHGLGHNSTLCQLSSGGCKGQVCSSPAPSGWGSPRTALKEETQPPCPECHRVVAPRSCWWHSYQGARPQLSPARVWGRNWFGLDLKSGNPGRHTHCMTFLIHRCNSQDIHMQISVLTGISFRKLVRN